MPPTLAVSHGHCRHSKINSRRHEQERRLAPRGVEEHKPHHENGNIGPIDAWSHGVLRIMGKNVALRKVIYHEAPDVGRFSRSAHYRMQRTIDLLGAKDEPTNGAAPKAIWTAAARRRFGCAVRK